MNKNFAATVECFLNETVRCSEMLLCIFCLFILYLQVQVLEVLCAECVRLTSYVKDVGNASIYQSLGFKSRLERSHENAVVNFKQTNLFDCDAAVDIASAN